MNVTTTLAGNLVYRGFNILTGFLVMLLLTRLMSPVGFGALSLMIANVTLFNLLSCLGAESGLIYHAASGKLAPGKVLTLVYFVFFFQLIVLLGVEYAAHAMTGSYWIVKGSDTICLAMGMVFLLGITLADKYTALLYSRHLYTMANRIILLSNLLALAVFFFYYWLSRSHDTLFYLGLYIATVVGQAVLLMMAFHLNEKEKTRFQKMNGKDIRTFFSYSFLVFVTNVIQFLAYRVDYWLVDHYQGEASLGIYALSIRLNQFTWVLPILAASIVFPMVADKAKNFGEAKLLSLLRGINTVLLATSLVAFFASPWLVPLLFGKEYSASVIPFQWLVPGFYLFTITILLAAWYAGKGKLLVNLIGSVICLALVLALDLWLIPSYGVKGAAIASSIAYGITAVYYIVKFCRDHARSPMELFLIGRSDWKVIRELFPQIMKKRS